MSVLKDPYVTPSRVRGVVRYLLQAKGQQEERSRLENLLSPEILVTKDDSDKIWRGMVQSTIRESIKMGLLLEDDKTVKLNSEAGLQTDTELPFISTKLFFSSDHPENQDFGRILAWSLSQDCYHAPANWQQAEQKLREQIGGDLLGMNDARYSQFERWSCYLGFSWQHQLEISGGRAITVTVPDPTVYLRRILPFLFDTPDRDTPIAEFLMRLARHCPVFEFGQFRQDIEAEMRSPRENNHLSTVTTMALRRLEDEKRLKLSLKSDTDVFILQEGGSETRVSHITWLAEEKKP